MREGANLIGVEPPERSRTAKSKTFVIEQFSLSYPAKATKLVLCDRRRNHQNVSMVPIGGPVVSRTTLCFMPFPI